MRRLMGRPQRDRSHDFRRRITATAWHFLGHFSEGKIMNNSSEHAASSYPSNSVILRGSPNFSGVSTSKNAARSG